MWFLTYRRMICVNQKMSEQQVDILIYQQRISGDCCLLDFPLTTSAALDIIDNIISFVMSMQSSAN